MQPVVIAKIEFEYRRILLPTASSRIFGPLSFKCKKPNRQRFALTLPKLELFDWVCEGRNPAGSLVEIKNEENGNQHPSLILTFSFRQDCNAKRNFDCRYL